MTEFPSDGEPSIVQAVDLRRLRCKMIRTAARTPERTPARTPSEMAAFLLRTALVDMDVGGGEALDVEEVLNDEEVLDEEEVLGVKEVLDVEEVLDEDVVEDEMGIISVYLHPKSVEEIGIINERTQTLDCLRSHVFPKRILRVYGVYSPTSCSSRGFGIPRFLGLTLHLADCDQLEGRPNSRFWSPMKS